MYMYIYDTYVYLSIYLIYLPIYDLDLDHISICVYIYMQHTFSFMAPAARGCLRAAAAVAAANFRPVREEPVKSSGESGGELSSEACMEALLEVFRLKNFLKRGDFGPSVLSTVSEAGKMTQHL